MAALAELAKKLKNRFWKAKTEESLVDLSFSRLQTYLRCPWMYHLVYDLGWRSGPNGGMALGMSLHRTLAAYHDPTNQEKTLDRLWQIYDEVWVNEGFSTTQETLDTYDSGRKMLGQFFETDQKRSSKVIATEKEFDVVLNPQIRFHGTLDRLDRQLDGGYEIVEYKTQSQHWTPNRIDSDLQMTLYKIGMSQVLGEQAPIRLKYHFLSSGESVFAERSDEQIKAAKTLMQDIAGRIRSKDYNPNIEHCPKCEFSNRCTNYQKQPVKN